MRFKGGDGREAYTGVQHAAKAGTVCLWHGWTPHQASANANDVPRLCIISRWWVISLPALILTAALAGLKRLH